MASITGWGTWSRLTGWRFCSACRGVKTLPSASITSERAAKSSSAARSMSSATDALAPTASRTCGAMATADPAARTPPRTTMTPKRRRRRRVSTVEARYRPATGPLRRLVRYVPRMAHPRKFRFGIQLHSATSGAEWADLARKAEDLGYSTLFMPDHFGDQLAPVPALMAAADATRTLNVGALVFDNDYKHPLVLAKEIATIDILSGGRVELGIGAGWMATDYEQSGIPYDRPGVRVDRMVEGIAVIKGMFADGPFSFAGEH